jgi:lipoprotein-anchoring transpeptidase ErfK/SrfK
VNPAPRLLLPLLALLLSSACVRVTPPPAGPVAPSRPASLLNPNWSPAPGGAGGPPAAPQPTPPPKTPPPPAQTSTPTSQQPCLPPAAVRAIQIRLDRALFSPGGIDGRWGRKTSLALADWQTAHDLPPTGLPDPETLRLLRADDPNAPDLYTTRTVTAADHAALRPYPATWLERSRADTLAYATIQEAVAEETHLFFNALPELNPAVTTWPNPPAGTTLVVPNVRRPRPPQAARLDITLAEKTVRLYDASDRLRARFPCSIAADKTKRPAGQTLHVGTCAKHPEYTFRPEMYADDPAAAGATHNLRIPPGPNNPVGLAWIGLDLPGYGIHGTPVPEKISHTESHGCFRLANWDALTLLDAVTPSLPVHILP